MVRSNKTKVQIYTETILRFCNGPIPENLVKNWINDGSGNDTMLIQAWVVNNLRGEIIDWATGIGVLEAAESMYMAALENGNLSEEHAEEELQRKQNDNSPASSLFAFYHIGPFFNMKADRKIPVLLKTGQFAFFETNRHNFDSCLVIQTSLGGKTVENLTQEKALDKIETFLQWPFHKEIKNNY